MSLCPLALAPGLSDGPVAFGGGMLVGLIAVAGLLRATAARRALTEPRTPAEPCAPEAPPVPEPTRVPESLPAQAPGADSAEAAALRIGILGPMTINGQAGGLAPAQSQLLLALALAGTSGLSNRQLCERLGADPGHPKPADSLRQLIARTRRQLGRASDGREWIEHRSQGQYALHPDARSDWLEFTALTDLGLRARDPDLLAQALSTVRGEPFAGCYYWWIDSALVETARGQIVAAADVLAEISLARQEPAAAARAARLGLTADLSAERLWRALMRAEHATGNLAGVRETWLRCQNAVAEIAADGQPDVATRELYRSLVDIA
jgi:DNA-binding SARP family transcriptional activator